MRSDPVTPCGPLTASRRRGVQLVTGVAVGGGLGAVAAPWWAWAVVLPGLWLLAAAMRRMSPSYLVTRCSG